MKTSLLSALVLFTVMSFSLRAQTATNAAPAATPAPAASAEPDKAMQDKLAAATKKAMADPAVVEAYKAVRDATKTAHDATHLKMKELDPTVAPLIDRDPKQPLSPVDKQKYNAVRKKALQDPAIKSSHEQVRALTRKAAEQRNAKIKELDPSLTSLVDNPPRKAGGKAAPAPKAAEPASAPAQ